MTTLAAFEIWLQEKQRADPRTVCALAMIRAFEQRSTESTDYGKAEEAQKAEKAESRGKQRAGGFDFIG